MTRRALIWFRRTEHYKPMAKHAKKTKAGSGGRKIQYEMIGMTAFDLRTGQVAHAGLPESAYSNYKPPQSSEAQ
jgi:hypothetical protein